MLCQNLPRKARQTTLRLKKRSSLPEAYTLAKNKEDLARLRFTRWYLQETKEITLSRDFFFLRHA